MIWIGIKNFDSDSGLDPDLYFFNNQNYQIKYGNKYFILIIPKFKVPYLMTPEMVNITFKSINNHESEAPV